MYTGGVAKESEKMIKRGYWTLLVEGDFELDYCDEEHIARMIKEGYKSGELLHGSEDDEED